MSARLQNPSARKTPQMLQLSQSTHFFLPLAFAAALPLVGAALPLEVFFPVLVEGLFLRQQHPPH